MIVRNLHWEHYGGIENWQAAFDPRLVQLPPTQSKTIAGALNVVLNDHQKTTCDPDTVIQAEIEVERCRFLVDVRGSPGGFERRVIREDGLPCPDFYDRIRQSREEEELAHFSLNSDNRYSDRFRRYRDAETFYPSRAFFSALTDGIGRTDTFRACLNKHIRDTKPEPLPCRKDCRLELRETGQFVASCTSGQTVKLNQEEDRAFELMCFLSVNRFWQTLEAVRDLHYTPRPLFMIETEKPNGWQKALSLGRQVFVCQSSEKGELYMENKTMELTKQEKMLCDGILAATYSKPTFENEMEVTYSRALLNAIQDNLAQLPEQERNVVLLRFRDGKTREEIAALGTFGEEDKVRYLEAYAFRFLRHPKRIEKYKPFLVFTDDRA